MERRLAAVMAADMYGFSRLMEADEDGTLERQKQHRRELIDPTIEHYGGRIIKTTGDGMLVTFKSAQDAVACAVDVQNAMAQREAGGDSDSKILYRVGINVGDVVLEDDDVFGDTVNIAARLEGLSEPGGVCIAEMVHLMVQDRLQVSFRDLGSQRVKNINRAIRVWQWTPDQEEPEEAIVEAALTQRVQFCITPDNVQLAYASVGEGPDLLKAPNWLNHIEYEWRSPVWGPAFAALARRCRLVRFDQRGNGLSDWDVETISADAMNSDMKTVVAAAGLEKFLLLGISQGCAWSVRYAVENPDQVRGLILLGGYLRGALVRRSEEQDDLHEATNKMILRGWGSPNPLYRHFFTEVMMPDATDEQKSSFDELQRISTTPENAVRINNMNAHIDFVDLARQVKVPTLVMHSNGDQRSPLEEGRRMAALIPGARFVPLEGNNHALIEGTEAFDQFFEAFDDFVKDLS